MKECTGVYKGGGQVKKLAVEVVLEWRAEGVGAGHSSLWENIDIVNKYINNMQYFIIEIAQVEAFYCSLRNCFNSHAQYFLTNIFFIADNHSNLFQKCPNTPIT